MVETRLVHDKGYKKPDVTYQDSLSIDEIKEKLKDYKKVTNIAEVPLNSHLRYFTYMKDPRTGEISKLFRMGGILKNKDQCDKYVVLSNGKNSWCVDCKKSVFWKKMSVREIHDKYKNEIASLKQIIKQGGGGKTQQNN